MPKEKSQQNKSIQLETIGWVQNEFRDTTKQDLIKAALSKIVLEPELTPGLQGLEPGMKLLVIFYFHRSEKFNLTLLQHPRGDTSRPKRGVFSLRSPLRPNPIGATEVDLISIEENILTVTGLDAIDGSPVLDIKPVR